jgi:hypothetical protein
MAWGGHCAGVVTPAPVSDEQWAAVSTVRGAISVPVHRKAFPSTTSAIDG